MIMRPGVFINDRYEIIDKVGSGGMADVYKAKDHRLNRYVAVKVLKPEFSDDTKFVEKFRAEAQSVAGLSHPNVVNVYDVGDEDGTYYIVMELVEGITLKSFIERKGKLDVKEAVGIAIQIAQGMEAAHGNHIVHRDIKPQNIIISREGKVKVTDFGIAKAVTSDTVTSNAMGSVHYLSPEQARGGFSDEKSDIYSLGVTIYEMLVGRVPFIGENTVAVALCHLQEDPIPLRDLEPSIPVSLDRIVQKCMQKKPEHRYLSASALIVDLKKSLSNPDGAYVQLYNPNDVNAAPTISLTQDDLQMINASVSGDTKVQPVEQINEEREQIQSTQQPQKLANLDDEDDNDEDDVNPKLEKLMSAGGILAAVLIVGIIIFILVKMAGCFGGSSYEKNENTSTPETTLEATLEAGNTVPEVTGLALDAVKEQLEELGLIVNVTEEVSDNVEAGVIIRQDVAKGTPITEDMEINLVVSSGIGKVKVPDVAGRTEGDAKTILEAAGFKVMVESVNSDTVAEGYVVKTSPATGTEAAKGENVIIYVSVGPKDTTVVVPNLLGKSKAEAKKALKEAGLVLDENNVSYEYSSDYAKNKIMAQGTTAGSKVEKGTAIRVTFSLGKQATYSYWAYDVTITDNPFNEEDETGTIKVILKQDGQSKTVYTGSHSMGDFPLSIGNVEGFSNSAGTLEIYLDGAKVSTQAISFKQVED